MADLTEHTGSGATTAPSSPPTYGVSRIALGASMAEFVVTVGQTRQMVDPATGVIGQMPGIEWLMTLAMSPVVAQQLHDALGNALSGYRKKFGKIPRDPNALRMTVNDPE